ncbi:MAG: hypothetical protein KDC98_08505 [Planctomycetes bacterium]|nr:hypothetical protein [Planctomycetota bacterium]
MNRWHAGSLSLLFSVATLSAQGSTNNPQPTEGTGKVENAEQIERANRVDRRSEEMRQNLGSVKQVKSHVRVQVRLKNGNRLKGVVKDGRLVERVNELRFVDADATDEGAGIRLWYSGGTRNYVFVPFARLSNYKILQRLSAKELLEIEQTLKMEEARREEMLQKQRLLEQQRLEAAAKPAGEVQPPLPGAVGDTGEAGGPTSKPADAGGKPAGVEPTAESAEQKQQRDWFALLQSYPPDKGWNEAKRDEIKRRFAVIGARPSANEQLFVDRYDDWLQACKHFGVEPTPGAKETPVSGKGKRGKK